MTVSARPRLAYAVIGMFLAIATACSSGEIVDSGEGAPTGEGPGVAPSGPPLVDGRPLIEVLGPPENAAGEVPLFRWSPVAEASRYDLAILGPEGPLWAWRGEGTEIYLGGLPFERPPGWVGPVLLAGSCWSVTARGADGHVVAVSEFLPVSPAESQGHTCVPGLGADMGG